MVVGVKAIVVCRFQVSLVVLLKVIVLLVVLILVILLVVEGFAVFQAER